MNYCGNDSFLLHTIFLLWNECGLSVSSSGPQGLALPDFSIFTQCHYHPNYSSYLSHPWLLPFLGTLKQLLNSMNSFFAINLTSVFLFHSYYCSHMSHKVIVC